MERRRVQVDPTEVARTDVGVDEIVVRVEMGRGQQIGNVRSQEDMQRPADVGIAEVEQAIAAQPQVGLRKRASRDVHVHELPLRLAVLLLQLLDHRGDEIAADIVERMFAQDVLHPVEVAARRVEQATDTEPVEQAGQGRAQVARVGQRRAFATDAFRMAPVVALVDLREALLDAGSRDQLARLAPTRAPLDQEPQVSDRSHERGNNADRTDRMLEFRDGLNHAGRSGFLNSKRASMYECRVPT